MKNKLILFASFLLISNWLSAQQYFSPIKGTPTLTENAQPRTWSPKQYSAWALELASLSSMLQSAPVEFTHDAYHHNSSVVAVPMPDGSTQDFAVFQVKSCAQAIYDRHPELRTFAGYSLQNKAITLRGSITANGFRVMVFYENKRVSLVEPFYSGQSQYYIAYHQDAVPKPDITAKNGCGHEDSHLSLNNHPNYQKMAAEVASQRNSAALVTIRTYRFAVACTGEFGQDNGGTQASAFAAIVEYANWVTSIYEREVGIRLQLVAESEDMAFFNPASDPFTTSNPALLLGQNPVVVNGFVGKENYDIGHVFSRYDPATANGILGIASGTTCDDDGKARGVSTGFPSVGYGADFTNTVAHETGHQFGANHTWNRCGGGGGRNGSTAFEPGSGTTILSYAGSCGSDNVAFNGDLYYHAGTIEEIVYTYTLLTSSTCGTAVETSNHTPEVTLNYPDNFVIPIGTPFELNGSATDMDGDTLYYCWEQINVGLETPLATPIGSSPLFRTFPPRPETNRYFPKLSTILDNGFDIAEQLPTYTRILDFRLSVRDNRATDGGISWKDVSFKSTDQAGPFLVTFPNVGTDKLNVGEFVNILWDVANTHKPPVSCTKVNIRLSTDGGLTWPITLASGVANDGFHTISVPDALTNKARIRVDAADNIFFDVSNENFSIVAPTSPSFTAALGENSASLCLPDNFETQVLTAGLLGFNNPVTLEIIPGNMPAEAVVALNTTALTPGQSANLSVNMENVTVAGEFSFAVRITAAGAPEYVVPVTIITVTNDFSTMALVAPTDGSTNMVQTQILRWSEGADANSYSLQVATSPSFAPGTIVASESNTVVDTFKIPFLLAKNQAYYWRIRPNNACSPHPWTEPYFFSTLSESCATFGSPDLPKNFPASVTSTVEATITMPSNTVITDINVEQLSGFHGEFSDLEATLTSPAGTTITLFKNRCLGYNGVYDLSLDDSAPNSFSCPPNNTGDVYVRPTNPLSAFISQSTQGVWTLKIKDNVAGEGGTVEAFQLDICQSLEVNPPVIVNNNVLAVDNGFNQVIGSDLLLVNDSDNTADQLKFTLVTVPYFGQLTKNGTVLAQGDVFTQADINNGAIRYYNYGSGEPADYFRFTVNDGSGGYLGTPAFLIQIAVDAPEVPASAYTFRLAPNPATETVALVVAQPMPEDVQVALFNMAGQRVWSSTWAAGNQRLLIPTGQLPRGCYFAQVSGASGSRTEKLILR